MARTQLVGISGLELRAIREQAGWTRKRLANALKRAGVTNAPSSAKMLQHVEGTPIVTPLLAQRCRTAIGEAVFDELLCQVRKASASDTLEGMIKRGPTFGRLGVRRQDACERVTLEHGIARETTREIAQAPVRECAESAITPSASQADEGRGVSEHQDARVD